MAKNKNQNRDGQNKKQDPQNQQKQNVQDNYPSGSRAENRQGPMDSR